MPRVKRGVTARAKHKKVFAQAKGFRGRRGNVFRIAKEAVMKAQQYAYRDRKQRKRQFRALWIARINAAVREHGEILEALAARDVVRIKALLADHLAHKLSSVLADLRAAPAREAA